MIDSDSLEKKSSAFQLGAFIPTDIAFMAFNGTNYLGLVGLANGVSQALRLTLDANGLPIVESAVVASLDSSDSHYCTASPDGTLFWVTNPQASPQATVTVFDTLTWTPDVTQLPVGDSAGYIAWYLVPEPSSLLSLLVGSIGILGLRRRRRRS